MRTQRSPLMRPLLLPLCFFCAAPLAQVYKSIGPDGRVVYGDRPVEDATRLDVPLTRPSSGPEAPSAVNASGALLGPYDAFEIASPEDNVTVRSDDREVPVSLLLSPPLQQGHQLQLQVNGVDIQGGPGTDTQLRLSGLPLGSHRLQAQVVDDSGAVVARTAVVNVHIRNPLPEGALP